LGEGWGVNQFFSDRILQNVCILTLQIFGIF
jgi:hypothetical protein